MFNDFMLIANYANCHDYDCHYLINITRMQPSIKSEYQYSKVKFYRSDGSGRDSYILKDSGGLHVD